jgi:hypothetical protein
VAWEVLHSAELPETVQGAGEAQGRRIVRKALPSCMSGQVEGRKFSIQLFDMLLNGTAAEYITGVSDNSMESEERHEHTPLS